MLFLVLAVTVLKADSTPQVTLAWDPSPSANIAGYRLYQGSSSGQYTNVIDVGNATLATVSNLVVGTTYFFAVSVYDILDLESSLSSEVSYTFIPPVQLQLAIMPDSRAVVTGTGPPGHAYDLLVTSDLQHWSALTNLTMSSEGTCSFTDVPNVPGRFYRLKLTSPIMPSRAPDLIRQVRNELR